MTVWELIGLLSQCQPGDRVSVPIEVGHVTIGRTPCRDIEGIERGFDWDSKNVFLHIGDQDRLTVMSKDEYIELIRYKQLVSGVRGKQDIEHLSEVFVKKDFVVERLRGISSRLAEGKLESFEISDLITDITEEKL